MKHALVPRVVEAEGADLAAAEAVVAEAVVDEAVADEAEDHGVAAAETVVAVGRGRQCLDRPVFCHRSTTVRQNTRPLVGEFHIIASWVH
jgi:hypothetical protein